MFRSFGDIEEIQLRGQNSFIQFYQLDSAIRAVRALEHGTYIEGQSVVVGFGSQQQDQLLQKHRLDKQVDDAQTRPTIIPFENEKSSCS